MAALGSSVINKSTKKFAPKKAPARRLQDADPTQILADNVADRSTDSHSLHIRSSRPRNTASPVASRSIPKQAPELPTQSPILSEQQHGNRSLAELDARQASSTPRSSSRQKGASQRTNADTQQTPYMRDVDVPQSQAVPSRVEPGSLEVDPVTFGKKAPHVESIYTEPPPAKRRKVTTRRNQIQTAPRLSPVADPNMPLPSTENPDVNAEEVDREHDGLTSPQTARTKGLTTAKVDRRKQGPNKIAQSPTETAVNGNRRPRSLRGKVSTKYGPQDNQDQDHNDESRQPESGHNPDNSTTEQTRESAITRGKKAIEDAAAAVVEQAVQGSSRSAKRKGRRSKRGQTPEESQHVQIDAGETRMADLCKDPGTGRKSTADKTIRENERAAALKKKRQEVQNMMGQADDSTTQELEVRESRLDRLDREWRQREEAAANVVPQQRIVNGEIVLDTTSLRIDRHAMAALERDAEQVESVEEDEYTRKVNSSLGLKRDKSGGWNEVLVDRFYDGLKMFGTDFGMISKLFPGKSRHSVKLKFCKEEKVDYPRIRSALLGEVLPVELEEFQKMTGQEYDDPSVLERDIEEDKKVLEEEQEKEKEAIEAARKERAEQAEAERLASQGEESSGKESRGRRREKGDKGRKRKNSKKIEKALTRTKRKRSSTAKESVQLTGQENVNEAE